MPLTRPRTESSTGAKLQNDASIFLLKDLLGHMPHALSRINSLVGSICAFARAGRRLCEQGSRMRYNAVDSAKVLVAGPN
jgi:hypothetical protein